MYMGMVTRASSFMILRIERSRPISSQRSFDFKPAALTRQDMDSGELYLMRTLLSEDSDDFLLILLLRGFQKPYRLCHPGATRNSYPLCAWLSSRI
jgi:hypothetical protein